MVTHSFVLTMWHTSRLTKLAEFWTAGLRALLRDMASVYAATRNAVHCVEDDERSFAIVIVIQGVRHAATGGPLIEVQFSCAVRCERPPFSTFIARLAALLY